MLCWVVGKRLIVEARLPKADATATSSEEVSPWREEKRVSESVPHIFIALNCRSAIV